MIFRSRIGTTKYKEPLRNIFSYLPTKREKWNYNFQIDKRGWYYNEEKHLNTICGIKFDKDNFVSLAYSPSKFKDINCFKLSLYNASNGKEIVSQVTKLLFGEKCSIELTVSNVAMDDRFSKNKTYDWAVNIWVKVFKNDKEVKYECIKSVVFKGIPPKWKRQIQPNNKGITNHYLNLKRK
jgi:hypothetical protein